MKTLLASIITAAITLVPATSSANNSDSQYPAANFQPKVVYLDKTTLQSPEKYVGEKSVYNPKYPAANFEAKVLYFDKTALSSPEKYVGEKSVYDPKYPAANFEPKVIYP